MTLPITPAQATALLALRAHAPDLKFVVIGAAAVGHYVRLERATSDVDLAIVIAPHQLDILLEQGHRIKTSIISIT
jgi:predicted nucleotidyltransferase